MPRKRAQPIIELGRMERKRRTPNVGVRLCFSADGVYTGDGMYRWWQEWDDSGYGWSGQFDILTRAQLDERIRCARQVGIGVFQKIEYGTVDGKEAQEWQKYEIVNSVEDIITV